MKCQYKVDSFGCLFSTRKQFTKRLQKMINKYVAEGWKLHSYNITGLGEICVVVFYRES